MEEDEIAPPLVATGFGRSSNGIKDGGGGGSCGSQPVEVRASSILFLPTPLERGVVSEVSERATTMSERSLGAASAILPAVVRPCLEPRPRSL
jgi:hypothetical protein